MKNICTVMLLFVSSILFAQNKKDIWSGSYEVRFQEGNVKTFNVVDTLVIEPSKDLLADDVAAKFEADLKRWTIYSKKDSKQRKELVRRFLFNEGDNEYDEFGWTTLHKEDKMHCLDGGNFFICQSAIKGELQLSDEKIFTETGIFGIWLHIGFVELKKISN